MSHDRMVDKRSDSEGFSSSPKRNTFVIRTFLLSFGGLHIEKSCQKRYAALLFMQTVNFISRDETEVKCPGDFCHF